MKSLPLFMSYLPKKSELNRCDLVPFKYILFCSHYCCVKLKCSPFLSYFQWLGSLPCLPSSHVSAGACVRLQTIDGVSVMLDFSSFLGFSILSLLAPRSLLFSESGRVLTSQSFTHMSPLPQANIWIFLIFFFFTN